LLPSAFPINPFHGLALANRLSYPFGYWNAVGAWGSMSVAIGLAWSAHDRDRARRAVALGLVPVAALAAYLSYSRASVGGIGVAVVAVIALSRHRLTAFVHTAAAAAAAALVILAVRNAPDIANGTGNRGAGGVLAAVALAVALAAAVGLLTSLIGTDHARIPRTVAPLVATAAMVVLVLVGVAFGPRLARNAWRQFRHPAAVHITADPASRLAQLGGTRYFYWKAAIGAYRARPFTGTGAGTFEFWWDRHGTTGDFVRNAHSLELENMAELGIPGVVLIVAVIAAAIRLLAMARQKARREASAGASTALLAAFLVYLLHASVDWMWQSTAVTALGLGGGAVAAARLSRGPVRIRWRARVGVVLAAACAVAVQVPGLLATAEVRRSQAAERAGNGRIAYAWANAAVGAQPWAASAYEQRGLVLESAGRLSLAARDLERAINREPNNFVHWLLLARVETERGDLATATRDYERARELRPKALVFSEAPNSAGGG
jgi:hypothetical protein